METRNNQWLLSSPEIKVDARSVVLHVRADVGGNERVGYCACPCVKNTKSDFRETRKSWLAFLLFWSLQLSKGFNEWCNLMSVTIPWKLWRKNYSSIYFLWRCHEWLFDLCNDQNGSLWFFFSFYFRALNLVLPCSGFIGLQLSNIISRNSCENKSWIRQK